MAYRDLSPKVALFSLERPQSRSTPGISLRVLFKKMARPAGLGASGLISLYRPSLPLIPENIFALRSATRCRAGSRLLTSSQAPSIKGSASPFESCLKRWRARQDSAPPGLSPFTGLRYRSSRKTFSPSGRPPDAVPEVACSPVRKLPPLKARHLPSSPV